MSRRKWLGRALAALAFAAALPAAAQYPARPIKRVVPYTPGGTTDSVTRLVTQRLPEALGQPTWVLFLAPAATPRDIVNRLSAETAKIVGSAEMRARFEQLGIEAVGSAPAEAAKFLGGEIAKWARVINTAGVKPE